MLWFFLFGYVIFIYIRIMYTQKHRIFYKAFHVLQRFC